jgi:hypothetical protein
MFAFQQRGYLRDVLLEKTCEVLFAIHRAEDELRKIERYKNKATRDLSTNTVSVS